ncbi:MAG: hypothetical protein VB108_11010, partial [Anaerolineaceae bacterium]|nr:hypothetical protein [Anaerolineaceae bacterium]
MSVLSAQALNPQDCLIFFASDTLSFEHLDWLETRERLFQKGSFALTEEGSIKAMLGLSLDLPELAWLSFFRSLWNGSHAQYFSEIYAHTQSCLKASNIKSVYCLGLKGWMNSILQNEGFDVCDWIISLVRTGGITPQPCLPRGLSIRQAKKADLAEVLAVDWASFSSQWRMSAEGLSHAFQKAGAFSLALKQEKLVGYAFSGTHEQTAHLDRLAILPDF